MPASTQASIPIIQAELPLIHGIQTDAWWQGVTLEMLEHLRRRLRGLVHLIERRKCAVIYSDFVDQLGEGELISFDQLSPPDSFEKFKAKARFFLRQHQDHIAVHKLGSNNQLTQTDLDELERMLRESGTGTVSDIERAKISPAGLGLFVRSLVGLDRAAPADFEQSGQKIRNPSQILDSRLATCLDTSPLAHCPVRRSGLWS